MALADAVVYKEDDFITYTRSRLPSTIFFEGDAIYHASRLLRSETNVSSIIYHNTDKPLPDPIAQSLSNSAITIFAVNTRSNPLTHTYSIPLGLERAEHNANGSCYAFNHRVVHQLPDLTSLSSPRILVSFRTRTNPALRQPVERLCFQYGFRNEDQLRPAEYQHRLRQSHFVISPPGNGPDTHREWEAFYYQTVPVILRSSALHTEHDLPRLIVGSYHDFFSMSDDDKISEYCRILSRDYPSLWSDYWIKYISSHAYCTSSLFKD